MAPLQFETKMQGGGAAKALNVTSGCPRGALHWLHTSAHLGPWASAPLTQRPWQIFYNPASAHLALLHRHPPKNTVKDLLEATGDGG